MGLAALPRHRLWLLALLAVFVASGVLAAIGLRQSNVGAAASVEPSVSCDDPSSVYGERHTCTGLEASSLLWPDGVVTSLEASRVVAFVGDGTVAAIDDDGEVLAATQLTIAPDITLECEIWDDQIKQVFELAKTDLRDRGFCEP